MTEPAALTAAKVSEVFDHEYEECFHDLFEGSFALRPRCRFSDPRWRYVPLRFDQRRAAWGIYDRLERRYVDDEIQRISLEQLRSRILD